MSSQSFPQIPNGRVVVLVQAPYIVVVVVPSLPGLVVVAVIEVEIVGDIKFFWMT